MPFAGRPGTYTRTLTDTALASAADAGLAAFGQELLALTPGELEEFCLANPDLIDVVEAALAEEDLERFIAGRALAEVRSEAEQSGTHWMRVLFPSYARFGFAPHMQQIWDWAWSVRRGVRPPPMVAVLFRGGTKALAVDTPIPTPNGWVPMGDMRPGMTVFDHAGTPVNVLAVSPIEERPAYRITFKDGHSIVASGDHLWAVVDLPTRRAWRGRVPSNWPTWQGTRTPASNDPCPVPGCSALISNLGLRLCAAHADRLARNGDLRPDVPVRAHPSRGHLSTLRTAVLTTEQIRDAGLTVGNEQRWTIPTAGPLDLPDAWLPIDPYLLGAWLGDGTSADGTLTVGFDDADAVRRILEDLGVPSKWIRRPGAMHVRVPGLRPDLRRSALLNNKHVPDVYLRASPKQRLALLQGLLDTDGTVARSSAVFTSTRQNLALAVAELASSLGLRRSVRESRAMLDGRDCGPLWSVRISPAGLPLFRLPRKAERLAAAPTEGAGLYSSLHYVRSIEPVGTVLVRCITVDSPGHCFLAGKAMVPTHNSTTAEAALAGLGARGVRRYALYVSNTQDQGDEHVANLGEMLASPRFAALYPDMAARAVTQYGSSRGWSRKRLHTASGFVVDALGLEKNVRGLRVDEERPDIIVLDDIDADTDGPAAVKKKIDLITRKILPTGSADLAVLAVQNLVHPDSIFARLAGRAEERADFLVDRIVVGPVPAIEGLEVDVEPATGRHVVVGGIPTWDGYGLERAQDAIDTFGYSSFLAEVQHVVKPASGGMFDRVRFVRCDPHEVPPLSMRTCWVDPAVEGGEQNDSQAIQIDGLSPSGVIYRLWSWEGKIGPQEAIEIALRHAIRFGCSTLGIETDQGGKTWKSVYNEACRTIRDRYCGTCWARFGQPEDDEVVARALRDQHCRDENHAVFAGPFPGYRSEKAGSGLGPKAHRASQMLADYEIGGRIVHVRGTHVVLEAALTRFPKVKPFDLTDASFYSWRACSIRRSGMSTGRSGRTAARTQMPSILG